MTKKKFEFTHKAAVQLFKKKSVQDFLKLLEHNKPYNSTKFKRMRRRWGCNAEVYINEQEQIVIKLGGTFDLSYIPTRAIPTAYFYDSDLDEDECILRLGLDVLLEASVDQTRRCAGPWSFTKSKLTLLSLFLGGWL